MNKGKKYLLKEQDALSGNWGASVVSHNGTRMREVELARSQIVKTVTKHPDGYEQKYNFDGEPPECFVA